MDRSRLARLPLEIREQIYELASAVPRNVTVRFEDGPNGTMKTQMKPRFDWVTRRQQMPPCHPLSITRTCRQMRDESHSAFYAANSFRIEIDLFERRVARQTRKRSAAEGRRCA